MAWTKFLVHYEASSDKLCASLFQSQEEQRKRAMECWRHNSPTNGKGCVSPITPWQSQDLEANWIRSRRKEIGCDVSRCGIGWEGAPANFQQLDCYRPHYKALT